MFNLKRLTDRNHILSEVVSESRVIVFRSHYVGGWPITYISDNISEFGYLADALKRRHTQFKDLMHKDDWAELNRNLPIKPKETFRLSVDMRIYDPAGSYHSVSANLQIIAKQQDVGFYIQGTFQENTSQRVIPLLTALKFGQFAQLIDLLPVPAMVVQGPDFHSNTGIEELTGYPSDEVMTVHNWFYLLYPGEGQDMEEQYYRNRSMGFPEKQTVKITRKDGKTRWVTISIYAIEKLELWFFHDISELRQSHETIKREQEMFEQVINALPVMVLMYNSEGRITYINKTFKSNTGYDLEYVNNHHILKKIFPKNVNSRDVTKLNHFNLPGWQEIKLTNSEGRELWSAWNKFHFDNRTKIGIGLDFTLMRHLEKTLKITQNQFRTIADQMGDFVFILDREKRYSHVYGTWKNRNDFPKNAFIGKTAKEFFGNSGSAVHDKYHERALRGIPSTYEFKLEIDGEKKWMKSNVSPLRDEKGAIIGVVGISHDITSLKKTHEQLMMHERALQAGAIALIIIDDNGKINWANHAATLLTGYEFSEIRDKPIQILKSDRQDEREYEHVWETVKQGESWTGEVISRRKDGSTYLEKMTVTPFTGLDEKQFFICVKVDISEAIEEVS